MPASSWAGRREPSKSGLPTSPMNIVSPVRTASGTADDIGGVRETAKVKLPEMHGSLLLQRDFQHAVQRDARAHHHIRRYGDLIHDLPFQKVLQRPEQVGRIDAKHRGAETPAVVERNNETIRILLFQTVHQMDLRANRPLCPGRGLRQTLDDVFGRTDVIGQLHDLKAALRMSNDADPRIPRPYLSDML